MLNEDYEIMDVVNEEEGSQLNFSVNGSGASLTEIGKRSGKPGDLGAIFGTEV